MSTDQVINDIHEIGYGALKQLIPHDECERYLEILRKLSDEQKSRVGSTKVPFLNQGHNMVYNIQNKSLDLLLPFLRLEGVTNVLKHFLNDEWYKSIPKDQPNYLLRSLLGRSGGPDPMPLHIDSFIPSSGQYCWSLQVGIVLEDQSVENGCTVFIPRSHKADRYATQADRVDAVPVLSKKGDVVIWDSRIWHGAEANKTGRSRWSVIATFGRWWLKQNYDIPRAFPKEFFDQLSDSERAVMGYCSVPPRDESEGIDIKGGYDMISTVQERLTR